METFRNWFFMNEMAVKTVSRFGDSIPNLNTRDDAGMKNMLRPGFRDVDRHLIHRDSAKVEQKLTKATEKYGIHWVIGYLEAPENAQEENPDHWQQYAAQAKQDGQQFLQQFGQEYKPSMSVVPMQPPQPNNTIVYIKPTSRVHGFNSHEQLHNIGHALWLRNPEQMTRAKQMLGEAVKRLQQSAYEADPQSPPPS